MPIMNYVTEVVYRFDHGAGGDPSLRIVHNDAGDAEILVNIELENLRYGISRPVSHRSEENRNN